MTRLAILAALTLLAADAPAAEPAKPTVAVLYFDYDGKSDDLAVLRKGLAQMLITDFAANGSFQVVERARLQDVLNELQLNQTTKVDAATANKIGKLLGAQYLVMGGYFEFGGQLVITAFAVKTETAVHLSDTKVHGKPDDFLDLEQKLGGDIATALAKAIGPATGSTPTRPAEPKPSEPKPSKKLPAKAAVRYAKALDAIDRKDKEAAKKELEVVVKEQPGFTLASAELANLLR